MPGPLEGGLLLATPGPGSAFPGSPGASDIGSRKTAPSTYPSTASAREVFRSAFLAHECVHRRR
jgi:hypothetical protein